MDEQLLCFEDKTKVKKTTSCGKQSLWLGDCIKLMKKRIKTGSVDVVVTSPPYNFNINYNTYPDNKGREDYLVWLEKVFVEIFRSLDDDGSFFLNIGFNSKDSWLPFDVASVAKKCGFVLQNRIAWIKAVSIGKQSFGHYTPINSKRLINRSFEDLFHFTKTGYVEIDRLSIGVPYADKSNVKRWKNSGNDVRCAGNCWFVPYETIRLKEQRGHPAVFPSKLPEKCIRLHGVREDLVVLDPFVGTGSTMVAAKRAGVRGIGIDIDEDYIRMSHKRLCETVIIRR